MTDRLLSENDRKEALSRVYVRAVAARLGYVIVERDFDRDGVDIEIKAGGSMMPALALQLKATADLGALRDRHYAFRLRRRNYDLLRAESQTPRLLVVLALPRREADWMSIDEEGLLLRCQAYWLNLGGSPLSADASSITVHLPEENLFTADAARRLIQASREGVMP